MNTLKVRLIFLFFLFIIIVIVFLFVLRLLRRTEQPTSTPPSSSVTKSPTRSQLFPTTIPQPITQPAAFPSFTGLIPLTLQPQEQIAADERFNLMSKAPIETTAFLVDHDYQVAKFVVTLKPDYTFNRQLFDQWVIDNGYNHIPKEEFKFVQQ